jgi:hypothetical protein
MNEHDQNAQEPGYQPNDDLDRAPRRIEDPEIIVTSSPIVQVGRKGDEPPLGPDETIVAETSQITHDIPIHMHLANLAVDRDQQLLKQSQAKNEDSSNDPKKSKDQKQPSHSGQSGWLNLVLAAVIALVCGVGGAWAFNHFESKDSKDQSQAGKEKKEDSSNSQTKNDGSHENSSSDPDKTKPEVTKKDLDDLKGQMQGLAGQMATLQERFESFASLRDDKTRDIGALQVKMKEVSHSVGEIADIPNRLKPMEERLNRIQLTVDELSFQLAGRETIRPIAEFPKVGDEKQKVVTTSGTSPIPASPIVPASPSTPDATMKAAVSFFKNAQYIQADQIFNDLQTSKSGDARVWYYSALSHGLATGKWDGETKRFVTNGADRESVGSPSSAEIDAVFADLTLVQGKDWLAAYRAQLVKH